MVLNSIYETSVTMNSKPEKAGTVIYIHGKNVRMGNY